MAWNTAEPYVTAIGAPVRVGTFKIGKGNPRSSITLSKQLMEKLANPKKCDVFIGDGEEAGQVLVEFNPDGDHYLRSMSRGGAKLLLPLIPGAPDTARKPTGARFEQLKAENNIDQLTIFLPW